MSRPCNHCRQDLSDATAQMSELFKRVKDIQQKAADSEVLVQEICRDIRKVRRAQHPMKAAHQHSSAGPARPLCGKHRRCLPRLLFSAQLASIPHLHT